MVFEPKLADLRAELADLEMAIENGLDLEETSQVRRLRRRMAVVRKQIAELEVAGCEYRRETR